MKKILLIGLALAGITLRAQLLLQPQSIPLAATLSPAQTAATLAAMNPVFSSNSVPAGFYVAQITANQTQPTGTNAYGTTRLTVILKPLSLSTNGN